MSNQEFLPIGYSCKDILPPSPHQLQLCIESISFHWLDTLWLVEDAPWIQDNRGISNFFTALSAKCFVPVFCLSVKSSVLLYYFSHRAQECEHTQVVPTAKITLSFFLVIMFKIFIHIKVRKSIMGHLGFDSQCAINCSYYQKNAHATMRLTTGFSHWIHQCMELYLRQRLLT